MVGGIGPVNDELMELLYNKDNSYESGHDMTKSHAGVEISVS